MGITPFGLIASSIAHFSLHSGGTDFESAKIQGFEIWRIHDSCSFLLIETMIEKFFLILFTQYDRKNTYDCKNDPIL